MALFSPVRNSAPRETSDARSLVAVAGGATVILMSLAALNPHTSANLLVAPLFIDDQNAIAAHISHRDDKLALLPKSVRRPNVVIKDGFQAAETPQ